MIRFAQNVVVLGSFALGLACGGQSDAGQIPAGQSCNVAAPSCASGTSCLTESVTLGGGCSSMESICTVTCADDATCVSLFGSGAHCGAGCNGSATVCLPPP